MAVPAAPTAKYLTGRMVAVVIGSKIAYCIDGSVDRKSALVKMTNSESGGYQEMEEGTKSATFTLHLAYNGTDAPNIVEGQAIVVIVDTLGKGKDLGVVPGTGTSPLHGRLLEIPARVASISDKWQADQDYTWTIQGESSGQYIVSELSSDQTTTTSGTTTVTDPTS